MTQQGPNFPVLCIAKSGFLTTAANRDLLETCGQSALDSGYFDGMLFVDTSGRSWEVRAAEKVANVGTLGGWRLLRPRRIRVRLTLAEGRHFGLQELRDRICKAIEQLPAQWEAIEETTDTKFRVQNAGTIAELIALFVGQS